MKQYTVIMLLPDYVASNYGEETYLAWVEAETVAEAKEKGQIEACKGLEVHVDDRDDFFVLFACEGHHVDVGAAP